MAAAWLVPKRRMSGATLGQPGRHAAGWLAPCASSAASVACAILPPRKRASSRPALVMVSKSSCGLWSDKMSAGPQPVSGSAATPVPAGLHGPASVEFNKHVQQFADDLRAETERVEAGQNPGGATPQFTAAMVQRAGTRVRLGEIAAPKKRSIGRLISALATTLAGAVAGVASNKFGEEDWATATLPAAVLAALVAVTYNHVKGE